MCIRSILFQCLSVRAGTPIMFYLHFLMTPRFPFWEFKKCLGRRGWKASWTGRYRIIGSKGQRRLYRFPMPVALCSLILHLHHLTSGHPDCQHSWLLSLAEPTLRMWLKSILLDPSLEVQTGLLRIIKFLAPMVVLPICFSMMFLSFYMNKFSQQCFPAFWTPRQVLKMILACTMRWIWGK